jgi:hypothetical protein
MKLKTPTSLDIPAPHQALKKFISSKGQTTTAFGIPRIPILPTSGSSESKSLRLEFKWFKHYTVDLLHPIAAFITQWLCDMCKDKDLRKSKTQSWFAKDMVSQWVWAFVWELLEHHGGPYIAIPWLQNDSKEKGELEKVCNLLDIFSQAEVTERSKDGSKDIRIQSLATVLAESNEGKVLRSNLFGVVVYLIYSMEIRHFTVDDDFNPFTKFECNNNTAPLEKVIQSTR